MTASTSVQHAVNFHAGTASATITIEGAEVSYPEPLDDDGYPAPGCAEWLISAAKIACDADARPRLLIWPDGSSTSLAPDDSLQHFPPARYKHLSKNGWPPIRWWKA
ncbi:hypothetical protein GCM10022280_18390 [Sphingomonas swuensis]|uniref:Uncharacterized protein n=1 Tax=Sphingomonas swuensis TaxID=977800 RepID=A0ABP7T1Y9_9SPHN